MFSTGTGPGAKGPDSNNKDGGKNGTLKFYLPADITVDPVINRMYKPGQNLCPSPI